MSQPFGEKNEEIRIRSSKRLKKVKEVRVWKDDDDRLELDDVEDWLTYMSIGGMKDVELTPF